MSRNLEGRIRRGNVGVCGDVVREPAVRILLVSRMREGTMRARITVITLGVDDLEAAVRFYRDGLGFPTDGIVGTEFEHGAVAFFDLEGGARLAVWPRESLAHDAGIEASPRSSSELSLGHNVASPTEVDAVMAEAEAAGARIVRAAHETFWGGYAGYFSDPDGHLWEVVWNPAWEGEGDRPAAGG